MPDSSNTSRLTKSSRALVFWAIGIVAALAVFLVIPIEFIFSRHAAPSPPQYAGENSPIGSEARGQQLIHLLKLGVLPKESGYLGIIGTSAQKVNIDGRALAVQSQNYYMLTRERPINYLHRLVPDDTHILIEGGPVDYFIFHPDGHAETITLGLNLAAGERPIVAVPGGCWKALRLRDGAAYALMANALSPEFTPDRVKIGEGAEWVNRFANSAPWATPDTLREFIGPNLLK